MKEAIAQWPGAGTERKNVHGLQLVPKRFKGKGCSGQGKVPVRGLTGWTSNRKPCLLRVPDHARYGSPETAGFCRFRYMKVNKVFARRCDGSIRRHDANSSCCSFYW